MVLSLLVLAFITRLTVTYDIHNLVEYPKNCPHGHSVYNVNALITITECVKECYRRQRCAGIRYHRPLQLCELYSIVKFEMDTSVDQGSCLIFAKTSGISHTGLWFILLKTTYTVFA